MEEFTMPQSDFEAVFSELAHALLAEKAPALMTYLVGFQVLDASDEGDAPERAAGVFGFRVNKNWLYAPVFFINGRIKGADMIYAKNQDIFVPLQDDWISYLLSRQPSVLGAPEEKEEGELRLPRPDFSLAASGQPSKYASASGGGRSALRSDLAGLSAALDASAALSPDELRKMADHACDLRLAFAKAPALGWPLAKAAAAHAPLRLAVERFYGNVADVLPSAAALGAVLEKRAARPRRRTLAEAVAVLAEPAGTVIEVTRRNLPLYKSALAEADLGRVISGETVYLDTRPSASVLLDPLSPAARLAKSAVDVKLDDSGVRINPSESGDYAVVAADGSKRDCYVGVDPVPICYGSASGVAVALDYDEGFGGLYRVDRLIVEQSGTWEAAEGDGPRSHTVSADGLEIGKVYSLVLPGGRVSLPFQVAAVEDDGDSTILRTQPVDRAPGGGYFGASLSSRPDGPGYVSTANDLSPKNPHGAYDPGGWAVVKEVRVGGKTYVFRAELTNTWPLTLRDNQHEPLSVTPAGAVAPADSRFLDLGYPLSDRPDRLYLSRDALWGKVFGGAAFTDVKVARTSSGYVVSDGSGARRRLDKAAAVRGVMDLYGLREADARRLLAGATDFGRPYVVKSAAGFISNSAGAPYPEDMNAVMFSDLLGRQAETSYENSIPAEGIDNGSGNESFYDIWRDPEVQRAIDAGNRGKKDVFDLSMVKGLVKSVDVSSLIDEYLPDLIRGMDRVARVLFLFYWHLDSFQERYGRQDVVELEDSLRNVFKGQGDLILFLRRKTVEAQPEMRSMDMELGDIA
jgi:hypothetical protein